MARMPGARWQGEHGSSPMSRHDIVCVHTIVGFAPAHAAHFSVHGDGTIDQSRDTRYRSAANLNGNYRVIAIENEDHGAPFPAWSGSNVPALTSAQVKANARILRWAHEVHGVPLQLCPNSRPSSRGLAYHRQGCDGNFTSYPGRVSGGELWSSKRGKVCPGDRRIAQLPEILRLAVGGSVPKPAPAPPKPPPPPPAVQEDDMYTLIEAPDGTVYMNVGGTPVHMDGVAALDEWVFVLTAQENDINARRKTRGQPPVQILYANGTRLYGDGKQHAAGYKWTKSMVDALLASA